MSAMMDLFDRAIPEPNSGCWLWTGATVADGYGSVRIGPRTRKAHRVAYEAAYGEIPQGMHVLHKCDVPLCINPDHLRLGSHADNMADMKRKGRHGPCLGANHGLSKLSAEAVASIRQDKRRAKDIAAQWGISQTHVFRLKGRHAWKHMP